MKIARSIFAFVSVLLLAAAGPAFGGTSTNLINVQYRGSGTNPFGNYGLGQGAAYTGAAVLGTAGDTWNQEQMGYYYTTPNPYFSGVSLVNSANAASGLTLTMGYQSIGQGAANAGTATDAATTNLMGGSIFIFTYSGAAGAGNAATTHTISGLSGYAGATANLVVYAGAPSARTEQIAITGGASGGNSGSTLTTSSSSRQISAGAGVAYNIFTNVTLTGGNLVFTVNETGSAANANSGYVNGFQLQIIYPDPRITNQPVSQRVLPGQTATFSVGAAGNPTLAYQWQANGGAGFTNLVDGSQFSGANSNVLTITNVTANSALAYQAIVSNGSGSVTSSPANLATGVLINGDVGNGATQTGAAILGAAGDTWNVFNPGTTSTVVNSANTTLSGVSVTVDSGATSFNTGSPTVDAATAALMADFAYRGPGGGAVPVTISGLGTYVNQPFTLVVYAGMDPGQPCTINITAGATGGNTASTLNTTSATRKLSDGSGVAYNTFTGTLTSGTLTFAVGGSSYHGPNGFQLQLAQPDPLITVNPVSRTNVSATIATFSVTATGSAPFSYQWQRTNNGTGTFTNVTDAGAISGSQSNVLTLASVTTDMAGIYQVIVSNSGGSATSKSATLTVYDVPAITIQPLSQAALIGNPVSFNVTALGTAPLSYQWQANGGSGYTNLTDGVQIAGSGTNILTISNVSSNWALSYRVIVSNGSGSVTSAPAATLTVYPNTLNINVDFGSGATQSGAAALGTAGETWNAVTGTTGSLVNSANANVGGVGLTLSSSGVFTDASGSAMDVGTSPLMQDYAYGNGSTVTVSLTGLAPYISSPFTLVVYSAGDNSGQGGSLTLTGVTGGNTAGVLNTSGTSRQISAGPGVAYNTFSGILTNGTLTLNCARLTGQQFTELNGLQLRFAPATNDPTLLVAPVSQTVPAGTTATFNVTAAGTSPFSYQWQVNNGTGFTNVTNGGQVSGATTNVLTISGVTASYVQPNWNWAGNYRVIVTNSVGSVTSAPATLSIVASGVYVAPGGDANGAVSTAYNNGGGTVNLGPGYYYGGINMGPGVTLNGAGSNTVIAGATIQGVQPNPGTGWTIQNLVVDGLISCSSFSVGGSGPAGILAGYQSGNPASYNITLNNVEIRNTSIALQAWNVNGLFLNHCNFHDNGIGFSHSIYATGDYNVNMNHCISSWTRTGDGIHLDFSASVGVPNTLNQCEFNGAAGLGVLNQKDAFSGGGNDIHIIGCKFQFNGQSGGDGDAIDTDLNGYVTATRMEYNHGYGAMVRDNVGLFYDYFNANYPDLFYTHAAVAAVASGTTANLYDACLADGVTGPDNTGDWVTGFGGQTEGAVSFANHPTDGAITWSIVSSTVNGSRPLNFKYSNGASSNLTMQVIVNGGITNNVTFPPTGGWSTYANASLTATNLTTQNNNVRVQLAYPGATSPILAALSVNDSVPGAPPAPTGLTYLALTNAPKYDLSAWIQLNWNPVPGATYYIIQRNGVWLAINVTNNSYLDKHVWTSGSAQSYTVYAVNAGGSSGASITAYSLTGFPISLSASANGPGSVVLNCNGSANAQYYSAYRATNANGPFTYIGNSGNTTFVDSLAPGGTVYYYMTANNGLTESLSSPLASANVTPITLAITNQPAPQTNSVGGNVAFSVGVTGYPVLTYQWQAGPPGGPYTNLVDGGIFSGVTNATLNLTGITTNQALTYRVIVTNSQGSVTSAPPAALTVNLSPTITNQPASQTVFGGRNASFTVGAVGVAPLSYQWQSGPVGGPYANLGNGGKFSGTTSNVLTIASVTTNQMQAYRVIVSNSYGAVTSSPALLTVQTTLLIDVDIGSTANVQTGPAVLGGAGDVWNGVTTATSTIKDSTGATLSGVGYAVAGYTGFNDQAAGSPHAVLDAATTPLMRDCVYGQNATFTVSLTGLSGYTNCAFTLVVYGSVGDPNQGDNLTLSGATGGNTASSLTTTGASRSLTNTPPNGGLGVTYQTFTGTLTSGTLTITCANNGNTFGGVNGFQLQVIAPAPTISANANLSSLTLSPAGTLSPAFSPNGLSYTATEAYGNSPTVTVVNADLTATNRLIYNNATNLLASGAASAPLALTLGATNVVAVEVTAQDGVTKKTYTVNVTQLPSQTKPVLTNSLSAGTVTLSWPGDHLGYRLLVQTNNLNLGLSSNPNDWTTLPGSATTTTTNFPIVTTNSSGFYRLVYP